MISGLAALFRPLGAESPESGTSQGRPSSESSPAVAAKLGEIFALLLRRAPQAKGEVEAELDPGTGTGSAADTDGGKADAETSAGPAIRTDAKAIPLRRPGAGPQMSTLGDGPELLAQVKENSTFGSTGARLVLTQAPPVSFGRPGNDGDLRIAPLVGRTVATTVATTVTNTDAMAVPPSIAPTGSGVRAGSGMESSAGPRGFGRLIPIVRRLARLGVFKPDLRGPSAPMTAPDAATATVPAVATTVETAAATAATTVPATATTNLPAAPMVSVQGEALRRLTPSDGTSSAPVEVRASTSTRTGTSGVAIPIRPTPSGPPAEGRPVTEAIPDTDVASSGEVEGLDRKSAELLESLDPEFRTRLERVIARMEGEFNNQIDVVETGRTIERQVELFAQGRTQPGPVVTWTLDSQHLNGRAADVQLNSTWNDPKAYSLLERIAQEEGLRTLGPKDPGHIEIASPSVASASPERDGRKEMSTPRPIPPSTRARVPTRAGIARIAGVARVASVARPGFSASPAARSIRMTSPAATDVSPAVKDAPLPDAPRPIPLPTHRPNEVITETVARALPEVMERLEASTRSVRSGTPPPAVSPARPAETPAIHSPQRAMGETAQATRPEIVTMNALEATLSQRMERPRSPRSEPGTAEVNPATPARPETAISVTPGSGPGLEAGSNGTPMSAPIAGPAPGADGLERVQKVMELQEQAPASSRIEVRDLDGHGTRLRMRMVGNALDARLDVQDQGTLQRMRDRVDQLHRSLEGQGIEVRNLDLRVGETRRGVQTIATASAGQEAGASGQDTDTRTRDDQQARARWGQDSQGRDRSPRDRKKQSQERK
jgi:hypothetical protein